MNKTLLPLCAVLSGNDYGAPEGVQMLLKLVDATARKGRGQGISRVESVFNWLSSFPNPKEALDEVSRLMRNEVNHHGLKSGLSAGMQEYVVSPRSPLALWFSESRAVPSEWLSKLPACFSQAGAQGLLSPMVLDAVVMNRVMLIPQVENSKLDSSHSCAKALRQAVYGILLARRREAAVPAGRERVGVGAGGAAGRGSGRRGGGRRCGDGAQGSGLPAQQAEKAATSSTPGASVTVCVEEYDRMDLNLKKNQVETRLPRSPVSLDTLSQVQRRYQPTFYQFGRIESVFLILTPSLPPFFLSFPPSPPPRLQRQFAFVCFWRFWG